MGIGNMLGATALITAAMASFASAATYAGNGGAGFGGPVGNGSLSVTENGANIDFAFTAGTAFSGNALILYVDSNPGGFTDTSALTDAQDGGRRAISGFNSETARSVVTFASGFDADLAITLEPDAFSGLFDITNTPANFAFVDSGGLAGTGSGPFTFSFSKAELGIVDGESFDFVGTLVSTSGYRSNETIGASVTQATDGSGNAGFTGTQTFTNFNTFQTAAIPEPTALTAIALGVAGLAARRRRA